MKKILMGLVGVSFVLAASVSFAETTAVTPKTATEKAFWESCKQKGLVGAMLDKCYTDELQKAANKPLSSNTGTTNPTTTAPNATNPTTNK